MRKVMITRTVTTTIAIIICADTGKMEMIEKEVRLTGTFKTEKDIIKAIEPEANEKIIAVKSVKTEDTLYGMPEADFVKYAVVLPDRKPVKSEQ